MMLNFRNTFTAFFFAIGIGNLLRFVFGINVPDWYYWLIGILALLAATYGSSYIASNYHFKVFFKGEKNNKKQLALTFDDGVDPVQTAVILDILKSHNINACFFLIGKKCIGNEVLIRRIIDEGHIIGNHTYSHSNWFDFYRYNKMYNELKQADEIIEKITGKKPRYFRPPFGVTNPAMRKALQKSEHIAIGWSIRSLDTQQKRSVSNIIKRVTERMKSGDIILFHDTIKKLPEVLEATIKYGTENGFTFVRLDELISENPYFE
jgi:peptidoglycan-N-acetylglucosamine deacetylase